MLNKIVILLLFFAAPAIMAQSKHSFVGVKTCGMCHHKDDQGKQLAIWEGSAHSKAYEALKTAEADSIAQAKGYKTKAVETDDCLKCHASGYNVDASLKEKRFKVEDGVQCETCHGPGSDYKSLKVMKDKKQAIAKGLMFYETKEDRVALCKKCHNSESPTFDVKNANFDEMWNKIKHEIPASK